MDVTRRAVALSVLSSPHLLRLWDDLGDEGPCSLLNALAAGTKLETQEYLRERYSADPLAAADQIIEAASERSIRVIHYWNDDYPPILRETARPPLVLYARGNFTFADSIAVVGTRKADPRSKSVARRLVQRLCAMGYTVVSGMALGIDREAHESALDCGGATIGVMANGVDIMYPSSNSDLYRRLVSAPGSGLVSEYPPGTYTRKWTFARRNRIISGLSLATVVVKAGQRSGALITAGYALEQNREVFACTGHCLDPEYEGCHRLIQKGAMIVAAEDDIAAELRGGTLFGRGGRPGAPVSFKGPKRSDEAERGCDQPLLFANSPAAEAVMGLLQRGEADIDSLSRQSGFSVSEINEAVIVLELSGRVIKNGTIVAAR